MMKELCTNLFFLFSVLEHAFVCIIVCGVLNTRCVLCNMCVECGVYGALGSVCMVCVGNGLYVHGVVCGVFGHCHFAHFQIFSFKIVCSLTESLTSESVDQTLLLNNCNHF